MPSDGIVAQRGSTASPISSSNGNYWLLFLVLYLVLKPQSKCLSYTYWRTSFLAPSWEVSYARHFTGSRHLWNSAVFRSPTISWLGKGCWCELEGYFSSERMYCWKCNPLAQKHSPFCQGRFLAFHHAVRDAHLNPICIPLVANYSHYTWTAICSCKLNKSM